MGRLCFRNWLSSLVSSHDEYVWTSGTERDFEGDLAIALGTLTECHHVYLLHTNVNRIGYALFGKVRKKRRLRKYILRDPWLGNQVGFVEVEGQRRRHTYAKVRRIFFVLRKKKANSYAAIRKDFVLVPSRFHPRIFHERGVEKQNDNQHQRRIETHAKTKYTFFERCFRCCSVWWRIRSPGEARHACVHVGVTPSQKPRANWTVDLGDTSILRQESTPTKDSCFGWFAR